MMRLAVSQAGQRRTASLRGKNRRDETAMISFLVRPNGSGGVSKLLRDDLTLVIDGGWEREVMTGGN